MNNSWITIDKMPENNKKVLVCFKNSHDKDRITIAYFIAKMTISEEDMAYEGDCYYNEEGDKYWIPEGWYEYSYVLM